MRTQLDVVTEKDISQAAADLREAEKAADEAHQKMYAACRKVGQTQELVEQKRAFLDQLIERKAAGER